VGRMCLAEDEYAELKNQLCQSPICWTSNMHNAVQLFNYCMFRVRALADDASVCMTRVAQLASVHRSTYLAARQCKWVCVLSNLTCTKNAAKLTPVKTSCTCTHYTRIALLQIGNQDGSLETIDMFGAASVTDRSAPQDRNDVVFVLF
jgi:hypothetical protein